MTDKPAGASRRTIASFAGDDDIPPPTREQLAHARTAGEKLGFGSEKAVPAAAPRAAARAREASFNDAIHVRSRPEDRKRFEEFAWRNRLKKGEAMTLLLDYAEAEERRRSGTGA
ncbi:hypothetical protein [Sphingomonas bacterium]|uniref:hypothetical protein n=1 Tax=Sphingomonas bacterium TaxID=1895847 RepID=UPI0015764CD2|nr:hypothetical protein [Sphingomonas bacterium]